MNLIIIENLVFQIDNDPVYAAEILFKVSSMLESPGPGKVGHVNLINGRKSSRCKQKLNVLP